MGNEVRVLITATDQATSKLTGVQKASLGLTAGFAAVGVASVKMAMDFEKGIDNVAASSGATKAEVDGLRKEALKLGADTSKSAGEAAKAFQELAEGGRTAAQIIGGEGKAAVALAEAANYDLAASAEYVATTLDAWKASQLQTNEVVNRSAGVALVSKFGVEDLAGAVAQAGGVAASMGVSFADMSTSIAATASSFASGADAGTSYKTFLLNLDGTTDKAKDTIKQYGLEFRNASGELKPMAEIVEELRTKVGTLGQAQQVAALKTIFGNDAYRTAAGLMNTTGEEFTALSAKMGATNAAEIAKQRMSNLSGSVEELKGSLETAGIVLGTKAIPALTTLSDVTTKAVNAFGALPESTQNVVLLGAASAAALPALIHYSEKATVAVQRMGAEFKAGKLSASTMAIGVTAIAIGLDLLLSKTTGAGLGERIFGDVAKMEGGKKALADWNATMVAAGPNANRLAEATGKFNALISEAGGPTAKLSDEVSGLNDALLGSDARFFGFNVGMSDSVDKTKALQAQTKLLAQEMVSGGASAGELKNVYDQLPAALRGAFDAVVDVNTAYAEHQDRAEMSRIKNLFLAESSEAVASGFERTKTPLEEFNAGLEEGANRADEFEKKLDALSGRFASTNPAVISLKGQLAALEEEQQDLIRSGGTYSETLGMTNTQIDSNIKKTKDQIAAAGENEAATKGMRDELKLYIGEGLLNLDSKLAASKLGFEQQITVQEKVGGALRKLSKDDIPGFIAGLKEVEKTAPGTAQVIYQALGPDLKAKLEAFAPQMAAAGVLIGDALASGLGNALARGMANVNTASIQQMAELEAAMRRAAETGSPSKMTYRIGVDVAKGMELGIADGFEGVKTVAFDEMGSVLKGIQDQMNALKNGAQLGTDGKWHVGGAKDPASSIVHKPGDSPFGDWQTQDQGGGQVISIQTGAGRQVGSPGPNGTVWDGSAYRQPGWGAGEWYGGGADQRDRGMVQQGIPEIVINIATVNARNEAEARAAGGDMAFSIISHGGVLPV